MRRLVIIAAIAVTLAMAISSCGSDTEVLTKEEFVEQADAICQASFDETEPIFDAVFADLGDDSDWNDPAVQDLLFVRFSEAMAEVKPILERQVDDIRDLEPPAADKELIETLLDDQDERLDEFARLLEEAAAGDEEARSTVDNEEEGPFADIDRRAREYGLTVCGSPGD